MVISGTTTNDIGIQDPYPYFQNQIFPVQNSQDFD